MNRRSFLRLIAGAAAAFAVAPLAGTVPEPLCYHGFTFATDPFALVVDIANRDAYRLAGQVAIMVAQKSPWIDLLDQPFPEVGNPTRKVT